MITKLEAVNEMLASIGENPVASLESGLDDAEVAITVLDRWSKKIQSKGWASNTEKFTMALDSNNEIILPANMLRIDTVDQDKHVNVGTRLQGDQKKLYDIDNRSFTFTRGLKVEVVYFLEFDELTFTLQNYIIARATQAYQAETMSSVTLDNFIERDEQEAWAALMDAEGEAEDLNMIYSNSQGYRAAYRHNPQGIF